jgi:hypothetical protein
MYGTKITTCHYKHLLQVVCPTLLRFPHGGPSYNAKVSPHKGPSCTTWFLSTLCTLFRTTEQGTFPKAILISKQPVSYRTRGDTCCPGGSAPKNQFLADSSKTNHISWMTKPPPPFQILVNPLHGQLTSRRMENHNSPINHKSTQHHEGWKTCTMIHDCRAKQIYLDINPKL